MYYFFEDKNEITKALFQAIKTTVEGVHIKDMRYDKLQNDHETVTIIFDNDYHKTVNVSCDSGIALMRDVLRVFN